MSETTLSGFYGPRDNSLAVRYSLKIREQIFNRFQAEFGRHAKNILDVGATNERISPDANFLEKLSPDSTKITAVGIEDAGFLEAQFPGLKFLQIEAGKPLPFPDKSFDVVFSHAVIEHVTGDEARRFFVAEMARVGKVVFLTTPNRLFPIETHTLVPLLHVIFPRLFYWLLNRKYFGDFYSTDNLSLLTAGTLRKFLRSFTEYDVRIEKVRLFGLTSNLIAILKSRNTGV